MARSFAYPWSALFPSGHELAGFNPARLSVRDTNGERASSLRERLRRRHPEIRDPGVVGELPDGRWAVATMTADGCCYAVEEIQPRETSANVVLGPRKVYKGVHFIPLTPDVCQQFLDIGLRHMTWEEIVRRVQERALCGGAGDGSPDVRGMSDDGGDGDVSRTPRR